MKKLIFHCLLALTFFYGNAQTRKQLSKYPIICAIDFNATPKSQGYSAGAEWFIPLNMWAGIGVGGFFGVEGTARDLSLVQDSEVLPIIYSEMSGTQLNSYAFDDLNSGVQFGLKSSFQYAFGLGSTLNEETHTKSLGDYLSLGVGLRFAFHPTVNASYRVESQDASYLYTEYLRAPVSPSYFKVSPEVGIMYRFLGLAYSYQQDPYKNPLHTLTLRLVLPRY